jgi:DNA-binding GntR family transcriptional regulator
MPRYRQILAELPNIWGFACIYSRLSLTARYQSLTQHLEIVEAVVRREEARARELGKRHCQCSCYYLVEAYQQLTLLLEQQGLL